MHANDIICHCMNVSVSDIKDAIDNGATNIEEVKEATSASTACGVCTSNLKEVVDDLLK